MIEFRITGLAELQRDLDINIPKQIRFATAQAINDCAVAVQTHAVERQLPSKLTLRSKGAPWWKPGTRFGVNVRPFANKETLRAVVGSMAPWLKLQEEGGVKTASGHRLAIEAGARVNKQAVLRQAVKPRQLLRRRGDIQVTRKGTTRNVRSDGAGFILNTRRGPAIYIRTAAGLKLMYGLEGSANIPAVLQFFESARIVIDQNYQRFFDTRLHNAINTAKPK